MNKLANKTRVILIGGSSHAGKSTLARSLSVKLGWSYHSTDKLARHPGRPWATEKRKTIPNFVAEHYKTLEVQSLFSDVLSHYENNVWPQIETVVDSHLSDLSTQSLVLEGSALWPKFVANLLNKSPSVKAIWLTASDQLFQDRIFRESNFFNLGETEKLLVKKFLARTLFYNKLMKEEIDRLGLIYINVESVSTLDELLKNCIKLLNIF